jgi:hypothetical protein
VKGEPKPGRHKYGFFNYSYFEYLLIMRAPRHHSLPPPPKKEKNNTSKMQKRQRIKRQESENHQRISSQEHKAHRRPITTHKNIKLARSSARLPCLACTKTAKREAAIALDSSKSSVGWNQCHSFI